MGRFSEAGAFFRGEKIFSFSPLRGERILWYTIHSFAQKGGCAAPELARVKAGDVL